jgi:hypothetical protein
MVKKDAEGEKQFAPFLTVYLSPGQGSAAQIAEVKKYIHDVEIAGTRAEDKTPGNRKGSQ